MISNLPLDQLLTFDVVTHDPSTSAVSDADSDPTFAVFEEATDTDIGVGGSMTKRTSLTGNYRGQFTPTTASGFEVGKVYSVIVSATVSSTAAKKVVGMFRCVPAETTAGQPMVTTANNVTVNNVLDDAIGEDSFEDGAIGADKLDTSVYNMLRDAVLDRVLSGNHDTTDTLGRIAQDLNDRLTSARSGYLDNLNIGENVAGISQVAAIQNTTRSKAVAPSIIERPDSGSITPEFFLYLYDTDGTMEDADITPTLTLVNSEGVDRSSGLSAVSSPGTGRYQVTYTVTDSHSIEALMGQWTYREDGNDIIVPFSITVVDTTAVNFTSADRTKLDTLHDTRLTSARAGYLDKLDIASSAVAGADDVTSLVTSNAAIKAKTDQLAFSGSEVLARAVTVEDKTSYELTTAERDAIATAHLDLTNGVETGLTVRHAWQLLATHTTKSSGGGTTSYAARNFGDTKDRFICTTDLAGNRSAFTYNFD